MKSHDFIPKLTFSVKDPETQQISTKSHLIKQLRQEAADLRARQHDYQAIQNYMYALEQKFSRLNDDKHQMEENYSERVNTNIKMIQTLKKEIEEQLIFYDERRNQNCDIQIEIDKQKTAIRERTDDIQKLKQQLSLSVNQTDGTVAQKHRFDEDLLTIRNRNLTDKDELNRLASASQEAENLNHKLQKQLQAMQSEQAKSLSMSQDLNGAIEKKSIELKQREQQIMDCDREIYNLKMSLQSYESELEHLRTLEDKYKEENQELHRRTEDQGRVNVGFVGKLKELDILMRQKEDQIMYYRSEIEKGSHHQAGLLQSSNALQVEIDNISTHIRVVSHQNEELTREIDQFMNVNQKLKNKLEQENQRRSNFLQKNDEQLNKYVQNSRIRSPLRPVQK